MKKRATKEEKMSELISSFIGLGLMITVIGGILV
jgi:hypothetical protein